MKKILVIILALTLTFAGCGSAKKEDLMKDLTDMDASKAQKEFEDAGYVPVEMGVGTIYIKIDGKKIKDVEELEAFVVESKDGVVFQFSSDVGSNSFYSKKNINSDDINIQYAIVVARNEATLTISSIDTVEYTSISVSYKYVEGEFKITTEDLNDEQNKIIKEHEKDAMAFSDKTFEELEAVIK